jgi:hypothetical protein
VTVVVDTAPALFGMTSAAVSVDGDDRGRTVELF